MSAGAPSAGEPSEIAGQRWRDATAELEYAERHGAPPADVERLASEVIEARVAMFAAGVSGGWQLPEFLRAALERDRRLLDVWPSTTWNAAAAHGDAAGNPAGNSVGDADDDVG